MKRNITLLSLVVALALCAGARDQWTLDGKAYDVDTLIYPHPVGPGVEFAKYETATSTARPPATRWACPPRVR